MLRPPPRPLAARMQTTFLAIGRALIYAVFCGEAALTAFTIFSSGGNATMEGYLGGLTPMNFFLAGFGAAIVVQTVNVGRSAEDYE